MSKCYKPIRGARIGRPSASDARARNAQALEQKWRFIAPDRAIPASCPANLT